jgi:hypothetical protein
MSMHWHAEDFFTTTILWGAVLKTQSVFCMLYVWKLMTQLFRFTPLFKNEVKKLHN